MVDYAGLQSPSTRHRHHCEVLHRVCLANGTLVAHDSRSHSAIHAVSVAKSLTVRSQFGSHQKFPLAKLHPFNTVRNDSIAAGLLSHAKLSPCVPLVWVPTWAFSFADSFVSSLVPLDELQSAGLIDDNVLLRPDLWAWPRHKNPICARPAFPSLPHAWPCVHVQSRPRLWASCTEGAKRWSKDLLDTYASLVTQNVGLAPHGCAQIG